MINDQKSVHIQPFSRIKQAATSGIGCNAVARSRCTPGGICGCVLSFREDGGQSHFVDLPLSAMCWRTHDSPWT